MSKQKSSRVAQDDGPYPSVMSGIVRSLERWLSAHTRRFADLPTVAVPVAPTPEDPDHDDGFAHDMAHMGELVERLLAADPGGRPVESMLGRPVLGDQDIPAYPGVDVLDTLAAVRRDLDEGRLYNAWVFPEALRANRNGGPKWVTA